MHTYTCFHARPFSNQNVGINAAVTTQLENENSTK